MKLRDLEIADDILKIVDDEITAIKNTSNREASDIIKLEKITKVYVALMANSREVLRSGVLGKIDLKELDNDLDDSSNDEDEA